MTPRPIFRSSHAVTTRSNYTAPLVLFVLSAYWPVVFIFLVIGLSGSLERARERERQRAHEREIESFVHCGMVWAVRLQFGIRYRLKLLNRKRKKTMVERNGFVYNASDQRADARQP